MPAPPSQEHARPETADGVMDAQPRRRHVARWIALGLTLVLLLTLTWGGLRARSAYAAYRAVSDDIRALETLRDRELATLTEADIAQAQRDLAQLETDLHRLRATLTPPVGKSLLPQLPVIGPRYQAAHQTLETAETLITAGATALEIGHATLSAFAETGATARPDAEGPTWLDVLTSHRADLQAVIDQLATAHDQRAAIATHYLPARVQARLPTLDRALATIDELDLPRLVNDELPLLAAALGGEEPVRYLILFQNTAELRLSGGFPGTVALVTLSRGQLQDYAFFDIYDLQRDYEARRTEPVAPPWPVEHYFRHPELPIQDATWGTDFAHGGDQLLTMYAVTGWPPIDGVAALTPAVVSDLLHHTGPVTGTVDGERREITAENVHHEIERQRHHSNEQAGTETHKGLLALVGKEIVEQLKTADRSTLIEVIRTFRTAAEVRDLQLFARAAPLQAKLDAQGWTGRLLPDPATPTLAVNVASLVTTKASMQVHPSLTLTVEPPTAGQRRATLTLAFRHEGDPDDDPFYSGFQRWWVELTLPEGSTRLESTHDPMPDPAAPNGGSYDVEIFPQQTTELTVSFTMPDSDTLLLRRQPGVNPVALTIGTPDCATPLTGTLDTDTTITLATLCQ